MGLFISSTARRRCCLFSRRGRKSLNAFFFFLSIFTRILNLPFHPLAPAKPLRISSSVLTDAFSLPVSDARRSLAAGQLAAKRRRRGNSAYSTFSGRSRRTCARTISPDWGESQRRAAMHLASNLTPRAGLRPSHAAKDNEPERRSEPAHTSSDDAPPQMTLDTLPSAETDYGCLSSFQSDFFFLLHV